MVKSRRLRRGLGSLGELARPHRVAGSGLCGGGLWGGGGSFPSVASSAPRGTAPNPGSKVRALRLASWPAVSCSANLTPENRHCRTSPADATEGNEPKTSQRCGGIGVTRARVGGIGRRSSDSPAVSGIPHACGLGGRPPGASLAAPGARASASASALAKRGSAVGRSVCRQRQPASSAGQGSRPGSLTGSGRAYPRTRTPRPLHPWLVFGSFPSVASAGLVLQCRFSGVKFALYETAGQKRHRSARTLLPGFGAVPLGADDATEGNEPHHPTNHHRRALTRPPDGAAPVPRGSRGPPEAPALHHALDLDLDLPPTRPPPKDPEPAPGP